MYYTGVAHETGLGTVPDPTAAEYWYRKAATAGFGERPLAFGMILRRQGAYWCRRSPPTFSMAEGRVRVISRIVEEPVGEEGVRALEFHETADVEIIQERVVLRTISLEFES